MGRIPTTQNSIKLFIQKEKANNTNYETTNLNSLLDPSANRSGILYALINNKNDETKHRAPLLDFGMSCSNQGRNSLLTFDEEKSAA
jgi:hypothetical protein